MDSGFTPQGRTVEYIEPINSLEDVDEAGRRLISDEPDDAGVMDLYDAFAIVYNWRASHHYPLNAMCIVLKQRSKRVHAGALISQRLKRYESIEKKLRLRHWVTLSTMQDIGGCRAVLNTLDDVYRLRDEYLGGKPLTHKFKHQTDYIQKPKPDGYRGLHLIYYYGGVSEKAKVYAEKYMQIEVQIRTILQHYWATAVETAETFTKLSLKSRLKSEALYGWREFFALVSSCFAYQEGTQPVPGMPPLLEETVSKLKAMEEANYFLNRLESFKVSATSVSKRNKYFLLKLDPESRVVSLEGFRAAEQRRAVRAYDSSEQKTLFGEVQSVLVSVDDVAQLKRAYPNYYADTTEFVSRVKQIISSGPPLISVRPS